MTTLNAFGFLLVGSLMSFLPALFPGFFPANSTYGANFSALWLDTMGIVQGSLGAFYLLRNEVLPLTVRLTAIRMPKLNSLPVARSVSRRAVTARVLRPSIAAYRASSQVDLGRRIAA